MCLWDDQNISGHAIIRKQFCSYFKICNRKECKKCFPGLQEGCTFGVFTFQLIEETLLKLSSFLSTNIIMIKNQNRGSKYDIG